MSQTFETYPWTLKFPRAALEAELIWPPSCNDDTECLQLQMNHAPTPSITFDISIHSATCRHRLVLVVLYVSICRFTIECNAYQFWEEPNYQPHGNSILYAIPYVLMLRNSVQRDRGFSEVGRSRFWQDDDYFYFMFAVAYLCIKLQLNLLELRAFVHCIRPLS